MLYYAFTLNATYFILGIMEIGSGVLRGMGKSVQPTVITVIGTCVLRIVWIYTVFPLFRTNSVLYYSYPISWFLTGAVQWILAIVLIRRLLRKASPAPITAS